MSIQAEIFVAFDKLLFQAERYGTIYDKSPHESVLLFLRNEPHGINYQADLARQIRRLCKSSKRAKSGLYKLIFGLTSSEGIQWEESVERFIGWYADQSVEFQKLEQAREARKVLNEIKRLLVHFELGEANALYEKHKTLISAETYRELKQSHLKRIEENRIHDELRRQGIQKKRLLEAGEPVRQSRTKVPDSAEQRRKILVVRQSRTKVPDSAEQRRKILVVRQSRTKVPGSAEQRRKIPVVRQSRTEVPDSGEQRRKVGVVRRKLRYESITRPGEVNIRVALLSSNWNTDRAFTRLLRQFKDSDKKHVRSTAQPMSRVRKKETTTRATNKKAARKKMQVLRQSRTKVPDSAEQRRKIPVVRQSRTEVPDSGEQRRKVGVVRRKLRYESITRPGEVNIRVALLSSNWNTDRAFTRLLRQFKDSDKKHVRSTAQPMSRSSVDVLREPDYFSAEESRQRDADQLTAMEVKLNELQKTLTDTIAELNEFTKTAGKKSGVAINEQTERMRKKKTATQLTKKKATEKKTRKTKPTVIELNFDILPRGQWQPKDIITYYKHLKRQSPKIFQGRRVQWDRITAIWKLEPQRAFRGKAKWLGYVVYDFKDSKNVILECAIEGNAVYILKGSSWKKIIRLSKGEIRDNHTKSYRKVVHRNDWLSRVKTALHQRFS